LNRLLCAAALVLGLVFPATAQFVNKAVMPSDGRGLWLSNSFTVNEGDWAKNIVYGTSKGDTVDVTINPTSARPGWLILTLPAEANLRRVWLQFYEAQDGLTFSYALGDTVPIFTDGTLRTEYVNAGVWDYCKVWCVGTAGGKCDLYWRVECYGQ